MLIVMTVTMPVSMMPWKAEGLLPLAGIPH